MILTALVERRVCHLHPGAAPASDVPIAICVETGIRSTRVRHVVSVNLYMRQPASMDDGVKISMQWNDDFTTVITTVITTVFTSALPVFFYRQIHHNPT